MRVQSSSKLLVKLKSIQGSDMLFIWYESLNIEIFTGPRTRFLSSNYDPNPNPMPNSALSR